MRKFVEATEVQAALSTARAQTGLTQREIATHLGVAQQTVSRWELGQNRLNESFSRPLYTLLTENGYTFTNRKGKSTRKATR